LFLILASLPASRTKVASGNWYHKESVMTDAADLLSGNVGLQTGAVVMMRGEIDVFTAPYFRTLVDEGVATGAGTVTLNLASVTFMDARRLSVLVGAARQLSSSGRRLVVQAASAHIHRLFTITHLTGFLGCKHPRLRHRWSRCWPGLPLRRGTGSSSTPVAVRSSYDWVRQQAQMTEDNLTRREGEELSLSILVRGGVGCGDKEVKLAATQHGCVVEHDQCVVVGEVVEPGGGG